MGHKLSVFGGCLIEKLVVWNGDESLCMHDLLVPVKGQVGSAVTAHRQVAEWD